MKKIDFVMILGITANVLAVLFVGYIFYTAIPQKGDLKQAPQVTTPKIEDPTLENTIGQLSQPETLPININPNDLGKSNPYNFK